jgi:hypothetical protein
MAKRRKRKDESKRQLSCGDDLQAVSHLKWAITTGKHWYIALLEAMGLWEKEQERYKGRDYHYLIGDEAFDWLLLAERLCMEIDGLIPEKEKIDLLFFAKPPLELSSEEFKGLIGEVKYHAYLNYLYGIVVEEALSLAVEEEVRKERHPFVFYSEEEIQQEAYKRIYGVDLDTLLRCFRVERGYAQQAAISLTEMKEFTYWLFQYRVKHCEKAKVASDTKKALEYLQHQWMKRSLSNLLA